MFYDGSTTLHRPQPGAGTRDTSVSNKTHKDNDVSKPRTHPTPYSAKPIVRLHISSRRSLYGSPGKTGPLRSLAG